MVILPFKSIKQFSVKFPIPLTLIFWLLKAIVLFLNHDKLSRLTYFFISFKNLNPDLTIFLILPK